MGRNKAIVSGKCDFQCRDRSTLLAFIEISDSQVSNARNRFDSFSIEWFDTSGTCSLQTLFGEIKSSYGVMKSFIIDTFQN